MKNTVMITLEDKKVTALKMYLNHKNSSLDEEISKYAEQLYNRIVPQNVRDYIDMETKEQSETKPKNTGAKANHTA
ncbi:MAG: DUF6103 family protein [Firmicutes bacterium]|nr:DUF6103 family protein [[Eubacterium] siraeum]MCM1487806.1 DUF6103 family protein [Bacillota bacterium]